MPKTIRLQNVPDALRERLESRAAFAGRSLSEHLLAELHRIGAQPSPMEMHRDLDFERFERLRLCRGDLLEARSYVNLILKKRYFRSRPRAVPARASYTAFVVSYSRPFSGNKDRGNRKVPPNLLAHLVDALPSDLRSLHEQLIEERNTLIAHTDATVRQIVLHRSPAGTTSSVEIHTGVRSGIGDEARFEMALRLVERLLFDLDAELDRLGPRQKPKAEKGGSFPLPPPQ